MCACSCYSGDCKLGVNEAACTPRLAHWKESAATVAALAGGQPIDLQGMQCSRPAADIDINTTMAGKRQAAPSCCCSPCIPCVHTTLPPLLPSKDAHCHQQHTGAHPPRPLPLRMVPPAAHTPPPRAGAAWEWMEEWLDVKEGKSGNTMPKQYRLGQFKQES